MVILLRTDLRIRSVLKLATLSLQFGLNPKNGGTSGKQMISLKILKETFLQKQLSSFCCCVGTWCRLRSAPDPSKNRACWRGEAFYTPSASSPHWWSLLWTMSCLDTTTSSSSFFLRQSWPSPCLWQSHTPTCTSGPGVWGQNWPIVCWPRSSPLQRPHQSQRYISPNEIFLKEMGWWRKRIRKWKGKGQNKD